MEKTVFLQQSFPVYFSAFARRRPSTKVLDPCNRYFTARIDRFSNQINVKVVSYSASASVSALSSVRETQPHQ
ncbi:hypothetical protein CRYUN_Cryun19dG0048300 [Craigia yunnanensis]